MLTEIKKFTLLLQIFKPIIFKVLAPSSYAMGETWVIRPNIFKYLYDTLLTLLLSTKISLIV